FTCIHHLGTQQFYLNLKMQFKKSKYLYSHLIIFYTNRRPQRATLFPYTTLFRSYLHCDAGHNRGPSTVYAFLRALGLSPSDARKDRKSTRLNSSHSQISYAVFCLKKKIYLKLI